MLFYLLLSPLVLILILLEVSLPKMARLKLAVFRLRSLSLSTSFCCKPSIMDCSSPGPPDEGFEAVFMEFILPENGSETEQKPEKNQPEMDKKVNG